MFTNLLCLKTHFFLTTNQFWLHFYPLFICHHSNTNQGVVFFFSELSFDIRWPDEFIPNFRWSRKGDSSFHLQQTAVVSIQVSASGTSKDFKLLLPDFEHTLREVTTFPALFTQLYRYAVYECTQYVQFVTLIFYFIIRGNWLDRKLFAVKEIKLQTNQHVVYFRHLTHLL